MNILIREQQQTPADTPDDDALLSRGNTPSQAFQALYERYVQRVYRYLYARVGSPADAEDLTSQTFLAALEALPRYRPQGQFAAWLFQIARNCAADHFRRGSRARVEELREESALAPDLAAGLLSREDARRLAVAIDRLEEDERELLRLRFAAGMTFEAMAATMGRGIPGVKMAYYRLIERLQRDLEAES